MKDVCYTFAVVFFGLGAWLIYSAMTLDVTVPTDGGTVANFQLISVQSNTYLLGAASLINSAVLFGSAVIVSALDALRAPAREGA